MQSTIAKLRLLIICILLPSALVAIDMVALDYGAARRWSAAAGIAVCSWFVVQTALLSFLAGAKLPHWGWRLLLLGWSLVQVNLLLTAGAMESAWDQGLLALAFLSAEIGVLAVWLILGSQPVLSRLGLVALAGVPVKCLANALHFTWHEIRWLDAWAIIVAVQIGGSCLLAALLRLAGYRIEQESSAPAEALGGPVQFSIRHLLVATTVVATLVPSGQVLLRLTSRWLGVAQWLHASADGAVLSLISLAALWAALGKGRWPLKAFVFFALAVAAGMGLHWMEDTLRYPRPYTRLLLPLTDAGWRWIAWTLLTGSFLAGMLLALRATGFRLVRRRRLSRG